MCFHVMEACLMCFLFLAFNENLVQLQPGYLQALHTHENIDYWVGKIFKEMFRIQGGVLSQHQIT